MNWTKELVLQKIQERHNAGKPLNYSVVVAEDEPLAGAARRLFRSWGNAVREADFDYDKIKREAWGRDRLPQGFWTPTLIVEGIMKRVEAGLPLAPHAVQADEPKLYSAGASHFGSWGKAVEAAGYDYLVSSAVVKSPIMANENSPTPQ